MKALQFDWTPGISTVKWLIRKKNSEYFQNVGIYYRIDLPGNTFNSISLARYCYHILAHTCCAPQTHISVALPFTRRRICLHANRNRGSTGIVFFNNWTVFFNTLRFTQKMLACSLYWCLWYSRITACSLQSVYNTNESQEHNSLASCLCECEWQLVISTCQINFSWGTCSLSSSILWQIYYLYITIALFKLAMCIHTIIQSRLTSFASLCIWRLLGFLLAGGALCENTDGTAPSTSLFFGGSPIISALQSFSKSSSTKWSEQTNEVFLKFSGGWRDAQQQPNALPSPRP